MKLGCFVLALFALFAVSCSACNGEKNGGSNGAQDLPELEIRLPLDTDVPTLDPAHMVDITSFAVASQIFGRLVRFDENVKLQNEMADSYSVLPDGLTITFKLKKGVLFHDHPAFDEKPRECTADDFVYSFTRLLLPETASERGSLLFVVEGAKEFFYTRQFPTTVGYLAAGQFADESEPKNTLERLKDTIGFVSFSEIADTAPIVSAIDTNLKTDSKRVDPRVLELLTPLAEKTAPPDRVTGLSAPDRYTFEIRLTETFGPFIQQMAMINFAPVPYEVIESAKSADEFSRHPIGTGAFRLKEWQVDRYVLLESFPQKNKPEPRIAFIRYIVIPERQTQFQMYLNNELDTTNVPTGQFDSIKNDPILSKELNREDQLAIQFFVLNLTRSPWRDELFQDKRALRQAVNYAINRDYICDVILEGRFRPFAGLIPPSLKEWTNPETSLRPRYTYDTAKASELLDQSGHPQGLYIGNLKLSSDRKGDYPAILTEVQGDLKNISIKTDLNFMEWSTYIDAVQSNKLEFFRMGWSYDYPDPDSVFYTLLHSSQRGASGNFAYYRNPDVDRMIIEARNTLDKNKRRQLYWQIEQIVLDDAPWIFAFAQTSNVLIKPWVRGVKLSGMDTDASLPNADLSKAAIDAGIRGKVARSETTTGVTTDSAGNEAADGDGDAPAGGANDKGGAAGASGDDGDAGA
jgi:ABC-type transport system substrate-binding protein